VYTSRRNRDARLLAGFVALYGLTLVAFFVFSRYRLHIVPAVAVFAAVGLIRIGQRLRQRDYRALFPVLPVMIVIALLSFSGAATFGITRHVWINSYWDMATLYENGGDYANSLALLLEADRFEPGRTETLCARGRVQLKSGRHGEAVELLSACLKQDANAPDGWYYLGRALEGTADTSAARGCYENQLAVSPGHAPARERLEAIGSRR
jgi:tetratricopeptide (TPR) repeat protein